MSGPPAAVAATRSAVRATLARAGPGARVLVACSGGADSLALAAATAAEALRLGVLAGAVVVDHGLQDGSADVAATAADQCRRLGLDPVRALPVRVRPGGGPEASARAARHAALEEAAADLGAGIVLLGHTRDDQAEQVLLGLLRGSGSRSLAGIPPVRGVFHRPFLAVTRAETGAACAAAGLVPWQDPHNEDRAHARVRVRSWLAGLEDELGPGIGAALARSASQLREDADLLDALADEAADRIAGAASDDPARDDPASDGGARDGVAVDDLAALSRPVRTRVWRRLLVRAGAPAGRLGSRHTQACDALVTGWHGQGPVHVPGPLQVSRGDGRVFIARPARVEWAQPDPPIPTGRPSRPATPQE